VYKQIMRGIAPMSYFKTRFRSLYVMLVLVLYSFLTENSCCNSRTMLSYVSVHGEHAEFWVIVNW